MAEAIEYGDGRGRWRVVPDGRAEQLFASPDGAAPAGGGQKLILALVTRVASRTVTMNAEAVRDTRLGLAIFLVAAATLGWPGGGGGTRPSAALFIDTVLFNVILLGAGLLLWAVCLYFGTARGPVTPIAGGSCFLVSWAERHQHGLLGVAVFLLLFSYIVVPIRAISLAHFAAPFVSRVLTSILHAFSSQ